jgi:uncharacterized caspase-like protein
MSGMFKLLTSLLVLIGSGFAGGAAHAETRIALVIGNAGYQAGALNTPANDAGLVAQTLQASGFDVVGARDLDQDSLRRAFRDFLDKAAASGTDTVAFIYLSGYGLQLEGENYFVPVDAKVAHDADVPLETLRLSDYTRPLAALGLKASIVVLDAARANPFAKSGKPLAGGLALVEPEPGTLIAFNAAPGTVGPEGQGPYGPYAQALAEMMREAGLPLADVFERTRLRVNDVTKGAEIPWHASRVQTPVVFFERGPDAPPPAVSAEQTTSMRSRPIRDLDAQQAYLEALDRDSLQGYLDFLAAYPDDAMAARVRAIVAARREAITWRRTRVVDTPDAYWSYLRRYPRGPHAADAERRLAYLAAALEPPPSFPSIDYDVPPPPPDESIYVDRPVLAFDDPDFAFGPPPPLPIYFLPPPSPDFILLPPPLAPIEVFVLPIPIYVPVPIWCEPPAYVVPPPNNVIFVNVHNRVEINNTTNIVKITNRAGQTTTLKGEPPSAARGAGGRVGTGPNAPAVGPALPPSVAHKASTIQNRPPPGGGTQPPPGQQGQPPRQFGKPLPGTGGQPLPPTGGAPGLGGPGANQPSLTQPGRTPRHLGKPLPGTDGQPLPPAGGAPAAGGPPTDQRSLAHPERPSRHLGKPLPGTNGQPLPPTGGAPNAGGPPATQPSLTQPGRPPRQFGKPLPGTGSQPLPPGGGAPKVGGPAVNQPTSEPPQQQMRRPLPPPVVSRPTGPAPVVTRPAPPPPAVTRPAPPPPAMMRPAPPPPAMARPTPPPPAVMRPPPAVARPAPPPPAVRPPPPPPAVTRAPPPAAKPANCGGRPCPR